MLITHTANGISNTARFIYGENGDVQGFVMNSDTVYMYLKNVHNDVIAVVNEDGEVVVAYSYDVWGKVTSTLGNGLHALQDVEGHGQIGPDIKLIKYRQHLFSHSNMNKHKADNTYYSWADNRKTTLVKDVILRERYYDTENDSKEYLCSFKSFIVSVYYAKYSDRFSFYEYCYY